MNLVDHTLLLYMIGQNLVFFLLLKSYFTADQVLNLLEKIKILLFTKLNPYFYFQFYRKLEQIENTLP